MQNHETAARNVKSVMHKKRKMCNNESERKEIPPLQRYN